MRGNEPFAELVLETADRNSYVLTFEDPAEEAAIQNQAPTRIRVRGELYQGHWNGRDFAHLQVNAWEPMEAGQR